MLLHDPRLAKSTDAGRGMADFKFHLDELPRLSGSQMNWLRQCLVMQPEAGRPHRSPNPASMLAGKAH